MNNQRRIRKPSAPALPARPENEHPFYQTWLEKEGYLKRHIDDACMRIAELTVENRELKAKIKSLELPVGSKNMVRLRVEGVVK